MCGVIASCDFVGEDSTAALPPCAEGQSAVQLWGVWGVDGNHAYNPNGVPNALAVYETRAADVEVEAVVTGDVGGVAFRVIDHANHWRAIYDGVSLSLLLTIGAETTEVLSVAANAGANGARVGVRCSGSHVTLMLSGVEVEDVENSALKYATMHGLAGAPDGAEDTRWAAFRVVEA